MSQKIMTGLVEYLFEFFRVTYGVNIPYTCTTDGWEYTAVKLTIPNYKSNFYSPALVLRIGEHPVLSLASIAPEVGHNERIRGELLEINSHFENSNFLWMQPRDIIGPIGNVLLVNGSVDKELQLLRLEVMSKAVELSFSGKYNTDHKATQKQPV